VLADQLPRTGNGQVSGHEPVPILLTSCRPGPCCGGACAAALVLVDQLPRGGTGQVLGHELCVGAAHGRRRKPSCCWDSSIWSALKVHCIGV